jgi:hypothetical protein
MDDFGTRRLKNPAHDVNGGVMAVEQAGRGYESDLVLRRGVFRHVCSA